MTDRRGVRVCYRCKAHGRAVAGARAVDVGEVVDIVVVAGSEGN